MQGQGLTFIGAMAALVAGCGQVDDAKQGRAAGAPQPQAVMRGEPRSAPDAAPRTATTAQAPQRHHVHRDGRKPSPRASQEELAVVTVTTSWSDAPTGKVAESGSASAPMVPPAQPEGVYRFPLAVSGVGEGSVF